MCSSCIVQDIEDNQSQKWINEVHDIYTVVATTDTHYLRIRFNSYENTQQEGAAGLHQWTLIICVIPVSLCVQFATLVKMLC